MKTLYVGDPHFKPSNLVESQKLMEFALSKSMEFNIDRLVILGDIADTHSVVRLEVLEFIGKWFNIFSKQAFKTVVLVGNHDQSGDYSSTYSALHPFLNLENDSFKIVHEPYLDGLYGYLPYIHDNNKFIEEANRLAELGATVLVSHPNYEGAVYDNGSPINNGVCVDLIDNRLRHLIGGHIHTELEMGRVWYTGNPRWLTKSCANKDKGIWLVTHNDSTGVIENKKFITTKSVCTPIVSLVWKEGDEMPEIPENGKVDIELHGSSDWVTSKKVELKGQVSISSKITDTKKGSTRKSGKSLQEFIAHHYDIDANKRKKLLSYLEGLNLVG